MYPLHDGGDAVSPLPGYGEGQGFALLAKHLHERGLASAGALVRLCQSAEGLSVMADVQMKVVERTERKILTNCVSAWIAGKHEIIVDTFGVWDAIHDAENGPEDGSPITGDGDAALAMSRALLSRYEWCDARLSRGEQVLSVQVLWRSPGAVFLRAMRRQAGRPDTYLYESVSRDRWDAEGTVCEPR